LEIIFDREIEIWNFLSGISLDTTIYGMLISNPSRCRGKDV
jgi:hypothetical protein